MCSKKRSRGSKPTLDNSYSNNTSYLYIYLTIRTKNGTIWVEENEYTWLTEKDCLRALLERHNRKIIGEDFKTVELGWPLGMPLVKSLGKGIWEVRSNFRGGVTHVLFTMNKARMVLLHGFIKKTQRTPIQLLELAHKRAKTLR